MVVPWPIVEVAGDWNLEPVAAAIRNAVLGLESAANGSDRACAGSSRVLSDLLLIRLFQEALYFGLRFEKATFVVLGAPLLPQARRQGHLSERRKRFSKAAESSLQTFCRLRKC